MPYRIIGCVPKIALLGDIKYLLEKETTKNHKRFLNCFTIISTLFIQLNCIYRKKCAPICVTILYKNFLKIKPPHILQESMKAL